MRFSFVALLTLFVRHPEMKNRTSIAGCTFGRILDVSDVMLSIPMVHTFDNHSGSFWSFVRHSVALWLIGEGKLVALDDTLAMVLNQDLTFYSNFRASFICHDSGWHAATVEHCGRTTGGRQ